ncbi:MAG: M20 family peptidase, partial [Candidatus Thorarchaeota archaeon]|nr:M20 family peptidase [Candidatus Thorarchaeota archaeon]
MWKDKARAHIDENKQRLIEISDEIHANPEVANEEVKASRLLADELEKAGFKVDLGVAGLETAILAIHPDQSDGPTIAILGEYDA